MVHWVTPDGQTHEQDVVIAPVIPDLPRFTGVIWLKYTGDQWTVVPISDAENMRRGRANEAIP